MDNFLNFFYSYLDKNQRKKLFILNNKQKNINVFFDLNEKIIEKNKKNMIYKEIYFFKKCNINETFLIEKIRNDIFDLFKNNLNTVLNNYFSLIFCDNISKDIDSKLYTVSSHLEDFFDNTIVPIENNFYYEEKNFLNIGHFLNSYYENKIDIFGHNQNNLTVNSLSYYYINDFDFFFVDYIDKCIRFVLNENQLLDNYYLKDSHLIEDKKISSDIILHVSKKYRDYILNLKLEEFKNIFDYFDSIQLNTKNHQVKNYNKFNFALNEFINSIKKTNSIISINDKEYNLLDMDYKYIIKLENEINSFIFKNIDFSFIVKEKTNFDDINKIYGFYFLSNTFQKISKKTYNTKKNEIIHSCNLINNLINSI